MLVTQQKSIMKGYRETFKIVYLRRRQIPTELPEKEDMANITNVQKIIPVWN